MKLLRLGMGGLALTAAFAAAATRAQVEAAPAVFDTRAAPGFGDATVPIRAWLARERPRPRGPQHLCVVGYRFGAGDRIAWVHWREGRRLRLWEGWSGPAWRRDSLRLSRRDLGLDTDVVATDADVGGSTFLVTRAWADRVLADCAARGRRYVVGL